jgi:DNA-binding XRE family transcriptional regulator
MDVTAVSADASKDKGASKSENVDKVEGKADKKKPAKRAAGRAKGSSASSRDTSSSGGASRTKSGQGSKGKPKKPPHANRVREVRIERMMSKAELARRAGLSVLTIDRVEKGLGCRMDTKRKILEALGLSLADRVRVFGEEE